MVLQNAGNVVFAKGLCNLFAFLLGQCNPSMVVIHAQLAVKVTSVFQSQYFMKNV